MTVALGVLAQAGEFDTARDVAEAAGACEDAGLDSIWLAEHAVLPVAPTSDYPHTPDGRLPIPQDTPPPDPLVWLAAAAGATSTIGLGTAYVTGPPRNPFVLAKQAASLERLAPGRVHLGLGVGWCTEELAVGGVQPTSSGGRLEEMLNVLRTLWLGGTDHDGERWSFAGLQCVPRPTSPIPLLLQADDDEEAERAGRCADGLLVRNTDIGATARLIATAREAARRAGRSIDDLPVTLQVAPDAGLRASLESLDVARAVVLLPRLELRKFRRVVAALADRWNR